MSLQENINQDLVEALKNKDEITLSTLRMLKSAMHNLEIEKGQPLTDDDVITVIKKEVKIRNDAIEQYGPANRQDLIDNEKAEKAILEKYLPAQITDDELRTVIQSTIDEIKPAGPQDFGKIMSQVMPKIQGKADGARVSSLVKEMLNHA